MTVGATLDWQPLTAQQADFWHEDAAAGPASGPDPATVAHALRLRGAGVDERALAQAIDRALGESTGLALRLSAAGPDGLPRQAVDPRRRVMLERLDLRGAQDPEAAAQAWIATDLAAPPRLGRDPLARHALLRLGAEAWLWVARAHHLLLDGYAMALIESRAARLYAAAVAGRDPGAALTPFAAYLAEEAAYLESPRAQADRAALLGSLAGAPPLATVARGAPGGPTRWRVGALPPGLGPALAARARAQGLGWPDLLTLAVARVLIDHPALPACHRHAPGRLTLWRAEMGRLGSVAATVPALVVNLLPLPLARAPWPQFLATGAAALRRQRRAARWRFERLAPDLGIAPPRRPFVSPLVNVLPFGVPEFPGCAVTREVLAAGPSDGLTLTLRAGPAGDGLALTAEADATLTRAPDLARLVADLEAMLARVAAAPPGADIPDINT